MTREKVWQLVEAVRDGNQDAFRELEGVARPLLISLSNRFSNFHYKLEFEDFYSIGLLALYQACDKFKEGNPSFLDFAKLFIMRAFWREIEYWNQGKRNVFITSEVDYDNLDEIAYQYDMTQTAFVHDFRDKLGVILDECFDETKSNILRLHYLQDEKVCDIAEKTKLNYKRVHKIIERGTKKIKQEYATRYLN